MKVFLTGATGYIGSAVARALLGAGYEVSGLTRSPRNAEKLKALGVSPVVGDLKAPDSYRRQADSCEVLIHAGFEYGPQAPEADRAALETLIASAAAARSRRLLVYTSGVWVLGPQTGAPADEESPLKPPAIVGWRPAREERALQAADRRVSAVVIRPGCVYGGQGGLYGMMFDSAIKSRSIRVAGSGSNCWASVYLDDMAELYRLIVEKRPRRAVFHATDGAAEPLRDVAEAFLDAAGGGTTLQLPLDDARRELGPIADALALDQRVSSEKAKRELGWKPRAESVVKNAACLLAQWQEKADSVCIA